MSLLLSSGPKSDIKLFPFFFFGVSFHRSPYSSHMIAPRNLSPTFEPQHLGLDERQRPAIDLDQALNLPVSHNIFVVPSTALSENWIVCTFASFGLCIEWVSVSSLRSFRRPMVMNKLT